MGKDFFLQLFSCSALGIDSTLFELLMALKEVSGFSCHINSVAPKIFDENSCSHGLCAQYSILFHTPGEDSSW